MIRRLFMFAAVAALIALGACSGGNDTAEGDTLTPVEEARVCRQAEDDVARVNAAPARSMEREGAILEIRAKEQSLRQAGYAAAADLYVAVADSLFRAAGAI